MGDDSDYSGDAAHDCCVTARDNGAIDHVYGDTAFGFGDSAHDCGDAALFVTLLMMMVNVVVPLASIITSPWMAGADSTTQVITFSINGLVNTSANIIVVIMIISVAGGLMVMATLLMVGMIYLSQ